MRRASRVIAGKRTNVPSMETAYRPLWYINNTHETYVGLTENDFKTRYRNHTASFRNIASRNSTELSKYVWSLKDNNINHVITWQIIARAKPYNSASKRCNFCLLEKFIIIREPHRCTLNKRNEPVSGCRHREKSLQRSNWATPGKPLCRFSLWLGYWHTWVLRSKGCPILSTRFYRDN